MVRDMDEEMKGCNSLETRGMNKCVSLQHFIRINNAVRIFDLEIPREMKKILLKMRTHMKIHSSQKKMMDEN